MIPTIYAAEPTVIPAQTFDKWWVTNVSISALSPTTPVHVRILLTKFRTREDGSAELSTETRELEVEDVLPKAAESPLLAAVVGSLLTYIQALAVERGVAEAVHQGGGAAA
jgi:hypothetical protein